MKTYLILAASLLLSIDVWCQYTISGRILDAENKTALHHATIYLTELNKGTISDDNGQFNIRDVGNGSYRIQITYLGYQPVVQQVTIKGQDAKLEFNMEKAILDIGEVVVSSSYTNTQNENTVAVDVIKKSDMQRNGAFTVMDVINKVPGVDAVTTGPLVSRPVIRGLSSNRVLTVADGLRFETQQWDDEHGIGVNELGIDRVEIIKGPSSLLYGPEAMGGIVHFVDENPAAVGTTQGSILGSLYSNNIGAMTNFNLKGAKEHYNWGINVLGKLISDYYYNGYSFRVPNTRMLEYGAKGYIGLNRKWGSTRLTYLFNNAAYGILDGKDIVKDAEGNIINVDTAETEEIPFEVEAPFHMVTDHRINSKTILLLGGSKVELILGLQNNHRSEHEELIPQPGEKRNKEGYEYVGLNLMSGLYSLKWHLPAMGNFSTIIGSQGMYEKNTNSTKASTRLIPDATIMDAGFMAVTKYSINNFNFSAGGRYDARSLKTEAMQDSTSNFFAISRVYDNVSTSLGAEYNLKNRFILRSSFSTGYRSPNLNELMANGVKLESLRFEQGNINLNKEHNNEVDLSLTLAGKSLSLTVSGFINRITDYIYLTPTGTFDTTSSTTLPIAPVYEYRQNNATIFGGEGGLSIHPSGLKWFSYDIKAATLTARRDFDDSYLPMMPTNKIYNSITLRFDRFNKMTGVFVRVGTITALKQFKVAANELKTPSYTLVNFAVGATLNSFEMSLCANNLLDRAYLDNLSRFRAFDIYSPGRNISFSLKKYFGDHPKNKKI
ncbi:MAG: TonB-dependent receptor [Flavobacteriales bacterium]|nr:TonB-dependent receptor [Flavobacteriales bacterium]